MDNTRQYRLLEIFFRAMRGESLSPQNLANEYGVSAKSITRTINDFKAFLADHRELVGNTELEYSHRDKCYHLKMEEFLSNRELFAMVEVMIGARAFSKEELLTLTDKLKRFTTVEDRPKLNALIRNELYHYAEVKHDCESVQERLWQIVNCITERREISVDYYRADRSFVTHRIRPLTVMFSDLYFYLIALETDDAEMTPKYFRIDRIKYITEHRKKFTSAEVPEFDEGELRRRSLFMWPGKLRTIRFAYTGPSVQAVLDKLPTSRIIERERGRYILEAEVYGDGIKMWLLSQGRQVQVLAPSEFVEEMRAEAEAIARMYIAT